MLAFVVNKVVTFNSKRISEKIKRRTPVCDHSDNGPVMIYRGEGEGRGGVGNGGFLGGHMVFSGKGGGISVVANRVKRGGGRVGCRKLIAN